MIEYLDNSDEAGEDLTIELSEFIETGSSGTPKPRNAKKETRIRQVENRWKIEEILAQKRLKDKDRDPFEEDVD